MRDLLSFGVRAVDALLVIKNVPARVCNLCDEALHLVGYLSADRLDHGEISRWQASSKAHSCREIDLMQTA